jgi:cellulose synthase/poly-beta-1,6-N-acetylglucosamine synthase-like glycosyltransferase
MDSKPVSSGVTVGICAYNEDKNIGKLLTNILSLQELPARSEVLVVCSGCTDSTVAIVHEYSKRDPRVRPYIESERKGKASAVNYILHNARGSAILFVSADTLPSRRCFPRLLSKIQLPNVGVVCGHPVPINNSNHFVGKLVNILWGFHDYTFEQLNDAGLARHATEIFCIRKGIDDKIPSETVNDDAYIALTAKKKGWLIKYETESRVSICGPQTFPDYFKQRRRVLFGHHQVKKTTGEAPQHLLYLLPLYPIQVMKLLRWLFMKYDLPTLIAFISIELGLNTAAMADSILRKPYTKWSVLSSTKNLPKS